jgi:hypothetical protein
LGEKRVDQLVLDRGEIGMLHFCIAIGPVLAEAICP